MSSSTPSSQDSQGSYYSFSGVSGDIGSEWVQAEPNFLANEGQSSYPPAATSYASSGAAYYTAPPAVAGYTSSGGTAMPGYTSSGGAAVAYDPRTAYDPGYMAQPTPSESWQPPASTAPAYLTPAPSEQVSNPQAPVPVAGAYGPNATSWEPNSGSGTSTGYATPQSSVRQTGFRCQICPDKQYSRARDLQRHMHSRHPHSESPVGDSSEFVDCQYCHKKNMRRDNLKRHIEKKHPRYRDTSHIAPRR